MTRARDIANLVDANGDVVASALNNVPPSNDASALTTGTLDIARISNGAITAAKLDPSAIANPGTIAYFGMSTAPTGWLGADGSAISRNTYADLFAAIGVTYGAGDGSTTFNIPDLRGEFIRGFDNGRGVDSGRSFGSYQADATQRVTGAIGMSHASGMSGANSQTPSGTNAFYGVNGGNPWRDQIESFGGTNTRNVAFDNNRSVRTAAEDRPRNLAMLACIKY